MIALMIIFLAFAVILLWLSGYNKAVNEEIWLLLGCLGVFLVILIVFTIVPLVLNKGLPIFEFTKETKTIVTVVNKSETIIFFCEVVVEQSFSVPSCYRVLRENFISMETAKLFLENRLALSGQSVVDFPNPGSQMIIEAIKLRGSKRILVYP